MEGPSDDFRTYVWEQAESLEDEQSLSELLDVIAAEMQRDVEGGLSDDAESELAAADSWASVASYPMARLSAPASPWPRSVAGWGTHAVGRLRSIATSLAAALAPVARAIGAQSFSVGVSFPWGISISLSW